MDDGTLSPYIFLFMLLLIPFLVIGQALKANTNIKTYTKRSNEYDNSKFADDHWKTPQLFSKSIKLTCTNVGIWIFCGIFGQFY